MGRKLLAAVIASLCLVSCQPRRIPSIFVNASDAAVQIRYQVPLRGPSIDGEPQRCRLDYELPRVTQRSVTGRNWHKLDWSTAKGSQLDPVACEIAVEVPAGATLLVDLGGPCSNYREYLGTAPQVAPPFTSFSVEAKPRIVLEGWQVADAFLRKRDICVFRYPAA